MSPKAMKAFADSLAVQDAEGHLSPLLGPTWCLLGQWGQIHLWQVRSASETAKGRSPDGVEKSSICRPVIDVLNILCMSLSVVLTQRNVTQSCCSVSGQTQVTLDIIYTYEHWAACFKHWHVWFMYSSHEDLDTFLIKKQLIGLKL